MITTQTPIRRTYINTTVPLLLVLGNFLSILTFTSPPLMCSRADTAEISVAVYAGTTIQTRATGTFVVV